MTSSPRLTIDSPPRLGRPRNVFLVVSLLLGLGFDSPARVARGAESALEGVHRVVFLGDSITYAGQFVEDIEAILRLRNPRLTCEFLNVGLPSETTSGLSEPGHAAGKFPRPDVHERLERVLEQTKPNLIVVCYGMNDGIYYPFDAERFAKYQEGIRFVRAQAEAKGVKVLHLTPPVFDPVPILEKTLPAGLAEYRQPYRGYDEVLERYSEWLLSQKGQGWKVVDLHGPLSRYLAQERTRDPKFRLAGDGVHMNPTGHWIVARQVLIQWGVPADALKASSIEEAVAPLPHGPEVLALVQKRQRQEKDAWLTATGHKRPGMKPGLPIEVAKRQGAEIGQKLDALLGPTR